LREPGSAGAAWRWALGVAAAVATAVACLFPLVDATYEARLNQDAARMPHQIAQTNDSGARPSAQAIAYYDQSFEYLDNYEHVEIGWFMNIKPDAAPPPGADRWPGPGQVIASPGLLGAEGGPEFARRYGEVVSEIGAAGLVNPREKVLYVGIEPAVSDGNQAVIDGFGVPRLTKLDAEGAPTASDEGYAGDVLYQWNRTSAWTTLTLFGVAPALLLVGVAARLGGERRDQHIAWLVVMGASPGAIRRFLARESLLPAGLGTLAGFGLAGLATAGNWVVPGLGAVIVGSYLRPALPWCLAAAALAFLAVMLVVFAANRGRRVKRPQVRPAAAGGRPRSWLVILPIGLIAAQSWTYMLIYPNNPGAAATISALTSAAVIVLLAPTGGVFMALAAAAVLRAARWRGSPAGLVAGRELAALPRPALRIAAIIAGAVIITVQAVLLLAGPTHQETTARAAVAADPKLAISIQQEASATQLAKTADRLPGHLAAVLVETDSDDSSRVTTLTTTCLQLERFGAPCGASGLTFAEVIAALPAEARDGLVWTIPPFTPVIEARRLSGQPGSLVIVSVDGSRIDRAGLTATLGKLVSPVPTLTDESGAWLAGATVSLHNARWLLAAGGMTATILFAAAVFALWFEVERVARRIAALTMMISSKRTTNALGIGLVGLPIAVATAIGVLAAAGFAAAPVSVAGSVLSMPWGFFGLIILIGVLFALSAGLAAAGAIRRHGTRWIPASTEV
jgi:hypothetical protein